MDSVETTSTKIHLTKATTISGDFFYTDHTTSGKRPRKNTYFRLLKIHQENSSNSTNFISSILSHWWILIFVNTENNPPEIRIHRKIRWNPESTERETSPLSFSNPTDSPIWLHFLVFLHLPCGRIKN